jgi:hypothetical protein
MVASVSDRLAAAALPVVYAALPVIYAPLPVTYAARACASRPIAASSTVFGSR